MANTADEIQQLLLPLYADLKTEDQFNVKRPLLAHYTSMEVLESIIRTNEIWFSNPLFMNDLEEIRFGILNGVKAARESTSIQAALGTPARHDLYVQALDHYFQEFDKDHVFDTYIFCASVHDPANTDGVLSMWRGYGGEGRGAGLIFDTAKLNLVPPPTPLILAEVRYETVDHRNQYLAALCDQTAAIVASASIPDNLIYMIAFMLFDRVKLFALFTRHSGFLEEREWRAVYRRDLDKAKKFDPMFGYALGPNGVEPKLKFKMEPVPGAPSDDLSLDKILHGIILGPTASSVLAQNSVKRMMEVLNRPELTSRVTASTIPLRQKMT
jgi:hypothetical protein